MDMVPVGMTEEGGAPLVLLQHKSKAAEAIDKLMPTVISADDLLAAEAFADAFRLPDNRLVGQVSTVEKTGYEISLLHSGLRELEACDHVASSLKMSIVALSQRALRARHDIAGLRRGLEVACEAASHKLRRLARPVTTEQDLTAAIRAFVDGDEKISQLTSRALMAVGNNAGFQFVDSNGTSDELKIKCCAARSAMSVSARTNRNAFALSALEALRVKSEIALLGKRAENSNGLALSAEIHVAGKTRAETDRRLRLYKQAILAAKFAFRDGVLDSKGVALMYAADVLRGLNRDSAAEQAGVTVIKRALHEPTRRIVGLAHHDTPLDVGNLIDMSVPGSSQLGERNCFLSLASKDEVSLTTSVLNALREGVLGSFSEVDHE